MRATSPADDSDDEVPLPPSFNSLAQSPAAQSPPPQKRVRNPVSVRERATPTGSPRRVVRLSSSVGISSGSLRRSSSLRTSEQKEQDDAAIERAASTPLPEPRKVRIHVGGSRRGSSARSNRAASAPFSEGEDSIPPEDPVTVARPLPGANQSSLLRYGQSTIERTRGGADTGIYNSIRAVKRVGVGNFGGTLMSGPARRGKLRKSEEVGDSTPQENWRFFDNAPRNREEHEFHESVPESQYQESYQEPVKSSIHAPRARDFASGSPRRVRMPSTRTSQRTSPQDFANSYPPATRATSKEPTPNGSLPIAFRIPPLRPDVPSTHDQENEPPPTFQNHKRSFAHADRVEDTFEDKLHAMAKQDPAKILHGTVSPNRKALQQRSQNTPQRPAPPPPKLNVLDMATSTAGRSTNSHKAKRNVMKVNGKIYHRLGELGKGGSSRVFTVMAESQKMFALKRVSLDEADEAAMMGYKGEIELLRKLKDVDRVITLYDFEINDAKGFLYILLEAGEIDFIKILELRMTKSENPSFDVSFTRHYWKEMLECIYAVHSHDIVHTDLKPANFVLVRGRLKLIDFGIANAINTNETVNIHRENTIGTPNYMSPESLTHAKQDVDEKGASRIIKLGKPSDIWSLGCILYQMTYGKAPFAHIQSQFRRIECILNPTYPIEYPDRGVGGTTVPHSLIRTIQRCLQRDQHKRPSAAELLSEMDSFLYPDSDQVPMTEQLLGRILVHVAKRLEGQNGRASEAELGSLWPAGYFANIRKSMREGTL